MVDRLIVSGLPDGCVQVSYRREGEDDAQSYGAPAPFESPLSNKDLDDLRWYLEQYLLAPYALYEERGSLIAGNLTVWGEALFETVFGPGQQARDAYLKARETTKAELVIQSAAPGFLSLPWELIKDPERPTPLALDSDLRGISRKCQVSGSLLNVPEGDEFRVLMVISRPQGLADIDFQMVARPLHQCLEKVRGKVHLDVVRPPTLVALEQRLCAAREAGRGYYAVHFDGHGAFSKQAAVAPGMFDANGESAAGFLVFEADAGGGDSLVTAGDFAQVIKRGEVPLVILNACQSATLGTGDATTGATVATRLLEEGVRAVVAMSYSVYAVAAAEFMAVFYQALFEGGSVLEATTAGRRHLRRACQRPSPKGELPLQDWTVPVLYARADVRFPGLASSAVAGRPLEASIAQFEKELEGGSAAKAPTDAAAAIEGIAASEGIFVGRGREFFVLDLAARLQRVVLIHGSAGTGKTELAKGFARWWRDTGGVDDPSLVFFYSFEPGIATFGLDGPLLQIAQRIVPPELQARLGSDERRALVVKLLREHAMLLVWDNFESVHSMADPSSTTPPFDEAARVQFMAFLDELAAPGGRSSVLITSRSDEMWLGEKRRRLSLGGLTPLDADAYVRELLEPCAIARQRRQHAQERVGYEALMQWLDGHPLSMKLVLPHLERSSPGELLAGLKGQRGLPPGFSGEGRSQGLGASMRYSLEHLDDTAQALLPVLSLFEGVVDVNVLMIFSDLDDTPAPFAGITRERWGEVLDRMAALGLLTALDAGGTYRLHPALPAYLVAEWRAQASDDYEARREGVREGLITAHAVLGSWLSQQIGSGNASLAFALLAAQRRTFGRMIIAALAAERHDEVLAIFQPLDEYLEARGETNESRGWFDRCLDGLEGGDGASPDLDTAAGSLWLYVKGCAANLALRAQDLAGAEATFDSIRVQLEVTPKSDSRDGRLATAYHQLGRVAEERGALDEAEAWYRKSLEIKEALGNRPGMAKTYHQLGIVAQARGALDDAEAWYRKSLEIKEALGNRPGMASSYQQLGLLAEARDQGSLALQWTIQCITLFEPFGHPSTDPVPRVLADLTQKYGVEALREAWQQVARTQLPENILEALQQYSDENNDNE